MAMNDMMKLLEVLAKAPCPMGPVMQIECLHLCCPSSFNCRHWLLRFLLLLFSSGANREEHTSGNPKRPKGQHQYPEDKETHATHKSTIARVVAQTLLVYCLCVTRGVILCVPCCFELLLVCTPKERASIMKTTTKRCFRVLRHFCLRLTLGIRGMFRFLRRCSVTQLCPEWESGPWSERHHGVLAHSQSLPRICPIPFVCPSSGWPPVRPALLRGCVLRPPSLGGPPLGA